MGTKIDEAINTEKEIKECTVESNTETNRFKYTNLDRSVNESSKKPQRKITISIKEQEADQYDINYEGVGDQDYLLSDINNDSDAQEDSKMKKNKKKRICSICSKLCSDGYGVKLHERTHTKNRERTETCQVCGLRFYSRQSLRCHMLVHKENREKRHKCEFCDKAFYNKGGLNVHRRIHLGQMIPCSLCSKQFFRQIDLDRHMSSHSASVINSDAKKRSRYFVRCKYCHKCIRSTSFKSHTAAHLNKPLMKCSICNKEFFQRYSCVFHIKKVHQKTNEDYKDFIIQYKNYRISHLFLEQKADIQFSDD